MTFSAGRLRYRQALFLRGVACPTLALALLLLGPATAGAAPEDTANEVAGEIMSPYCPGVTLHDCPSGAATKLRDRIAGWARDGWTKDRILDELKAEFGPSILAAPPSEGAGLVAWILPGAVVLAGALTALVLARRWTKRASKEAVGSTEGITSEDRRRLEAELSELRWRTEA